MNILLTNDDGFESLGMEILYKKVKHLGNVTIIAPENEQSATSHGITLRKPVFIKRINKNIYSVSGTPTDCIVLAFRAKIFPSPDIVISGINSGYNVGEDILYSGTFAAAAEAALCNIPSVAVSTVKGNNSKPFEQAADILLSIIDNIIEVGGLWNINIPGEKCLGIKLASLGHRVYDTEIKPRFDPYGRPYYWISGDKPLWEKDEKTDITIVENGYASLTPFKFNRIEDKFLFKKMKKILMEKK